MEDAGQQGRDRSSPASVSSFASHTGDGLVPHNHMDKPLPPKDERIVSTNPSPDAAITGFVRNVSKPSELVIASGSQTPANPSNSYSLPEQTYFYGGYDNGSVNWGEHLNYVHANNLQLMPQAIYNDNASLLFHPAYAYEAYGQFSPMASPLSPIMIDGQLYSPHQVPISPSYYSQAVSPSLPHVTSPLPTDSVTTSSSELGYYVHYGSFDGSNPSGNNSLGFYNFSGDTGSGESVSNQSMPTSGSLYPTPVGILGPYEHSFGQQIQYHGYGLVSDSSTRRYSQSGSFQGSSYSSSLNRLALEKGGKFRERDSVSMMIESHTNISDRNRGPRALKLQGNGIPEQTTPADGKDSPASLRPTKLYNRPDFVTTYEIAKFFVIKSFSEDNVHRSIKYGVWASTSLGNRKLDAAYQEAKEAGGNAPIFLFFSVNASGQFCGVAEMVGPVDFENDADYWQQNRWSGQFRVQWHIIKDVPNSRFRHIILKNNENKPVTHSRDSQEVELEEGNKMLKIFKEHDVDTSILDDFSFYDAREMDLQEKRSKEQDFSAKTADDASITQLSDKISESLQLDKHKEV